MDGINKLVFLFLTLIIVVIFFAVVSGRINLKGKFPSLWVWPTKTTSVITPTPKTKTIKVTSETSGTINLYQTPTLIPAQKYTKINSIPKTGTPTLFIPLAILSFFAGMHLRKEI